MRSCGGQPLSWIGTNPSQGAFLVSSPTHYEIRSGVAQGYLGVRRHACSMRASASACAVVRSGCCRRCCQNRVHTPPRHPTW